MKKLFILSTAALAAMSVSAETLSPEQAWSRAMNSNRAKAAGLNVSADAKCVMKIKATGDSDAAVYVFDSERGSCFISADDCAAPLLGYSDIAISDTAAIPANLRWWLDFYASEIASARATVSGRYEAPNRPSRAAIAPMTTTRWNQDAPYNALCPKVGNQPTMTGCVATAMAQVMKYHNWPEKGQSSNSYSWNGETISMDFASTTFDWENMTDTYDSSSSATSKTAVARLMKACGYAVNMNYGTSESGAISERVAPALLKFFNYDKGIANAPRNIYGNEEWETLIYNSLAESGPVFYSGSNSMAGHAFVCDGYQADGYFHFNWGWGGISDGYFLLSALNPASQGIGGSTSGYNSGQVAIIGIRPPKSGSEASSPLFVATETPSALFVGSSFYFFGPFFNYSVTDKEGYFSLKYVNTATGANGTFQGQSSVIQCGMGVSQISLNLASFPRGNYKFYPVFVESNGTGHEVSFPPYMENYATVNISSAGNSAYIPSKGDLNTTSLDFMSDFYLNNLFYVKATIENGASVDYNREIYPLLLRSESITDIAAIGSELAVDFPASGTTVVDYVGQWVKRPASSPSLTAGDYYFVLAVENGYGVSGSSAYTSYKAISPAYPVTLKSASAPTLSATLTPAARSMAADNLEFDLNLTCVQGYFANAVSVAIFPEAGGSSLAMFGTDYAFLNAGDSKRMTVKGNFPTAEAGKSYLAVAFYGNTQISQPATFSISSMTGIEDISATGSDWAFDLDGDIANVAAPAAIGSVEVYSASGIKAAVGVSVDGNRAVLSTSALQSGVYFAVVNTDGGSKSFKFVIR